MLILRMLHKNMLVAWESFPPQLTIQLAGHIGEDEYMAFGLSGEQGKSSMKGGDVAVAYMDEYLGHVEDYNLTARFFFYAHYSNVIKVSSCAAQLLAFEGRP